MDQLWFVTRIKKWYTQSDQTNIMLPVDSNQMDKGRMINLIIQLNGYSKGEIIRSSLAAFTASNWEILLIFLASRDGDVDKAMKSINLEYWCIYHLLIKFPSKHSELKLQTSKSRVKSWTPRFLYSSYGRGVHPLLSTQCHVWFIWEVKLIQDRGVDGLHLGNWFTRSSWALEIKNANMDRF